MFVQSGRLLLRGWSYCAYQDQMQVQEVSNSSKLPFFYVVLLVTNIKSLKRYVPRWTSEGLGICRIPLVRGTLKWSSIRANIYLSRIDGKCNHNDEHHFQKPGLFISDVSMIQEQEAHQHFEMKCLRRRAKSLENEFLAHSRIIFGRATNPLEKMTRGSCANSTPSETE